MKFINCNLTVDILKLNSLKHKTPVLHLSGQNLTGEISCKSNNWAGQHSEQINKIQ